MTKTLALSALLLSAAACAAPAPEPAPAPVAVPAKAPEKKQDRLLLWPNGAPGAVGEEERDKPSITAFPAPEEKATGAACIVCPGGGYGGLMTSYEGDEVCQWLNGIGVHAFTLRYRLGPRYHHPAMMNDVNRAVRMVRSRAAEWKIDPEKIGVWGFSAGGHLAATAATHFDDGKADAEDPVEKVSSRPNFAIMTYPVISLVAPYVHVGSMKNLLGAEGMKNMELREFLSPEKQVTAKTPPCFLMHSWEDTVPAENSIDFYLALRKMKIPAELHVYEKGPHGYGLGLKDPVLKSWPERLTDWLRVRGMLKK
jgi:acetyl esterase/lipase